jgi:hypothetical protein
MIYDRIDRDIPAFVMPSLDVVAFGFLAWLQARRRRCAGVAGMGFGGEEDDGSVGRRSMMTTKVSNEDMEARSRADYLQCVGVNESKVEVRQKRPWVDAMHPRIRRRLSAVSDLNTKKLLPYAFAIYIMFLTGWHS